MSSQTHSWHLNSTDSSRSHHIIRLLFQHNSGLVWTLFDLHKHTFLMSLSLSSTFIIATVSDALSLHTDVKSELDRIAASCIPHAKPSVFQESTLGSDLHVDCVWKKLRETQPEVWTWQSFGSNIWEASGSVLFHLPSLQRFRESNERLTPRSWKNHTDVIKKSLWRESAGDTDTSESNSRS